MPSPHLVTRNAASFHSLSTHRFPEHRWNFELPTLLRPSSRTVFLSQAPYHRFRPERLPAAAFASRILPTEKKPTLAPPAFLTVLPTPGSFRCPGTNSDRICRCQLWALRFLPFSFDRPTKSQIRRTTITVRVGGFSETNTEPYLFRSLGRRRPSILLCHQSLKAFLLPHPSYLSRPLIVRYVVWLRLAPRTPNMPPISVRQATWPRFCLPEA